MQMSPEPRNKTGHWTQSTEPAELTKVYQSLSVSPEPCLSLGSPLLLPRPSCQRLQPQPQPQPQWGCWGHDAEVLSTSEDQGSSPALQLPEVHRACKSSVFSQVGTPRPLKMQTVSRPLLIHHGAKRKTHSLTAACPVLLGPACPPGFYPHLLPAFVKCLCTSPLYVQ